MRFHCQTVFMRKAMYTMKRRRLLLLPLLVLLPLIGIPTGFLVREYRQERLNRELIEAIKADDTTAALDALQAGANVNAVISGEKAPTIGEMLQRFVFRWTHRNKKPDNAPHSTALLILLGERPVSSQASATTLGTSSRFNSNPRDPIKTTIQEGIYDVYGIHNLTLLKALLEQGADVNARDEYNYTALLFATRWDQLDSMRLLIQYGADVKLKDNNGDMALHWAALNGNTEAVQELIAQGADVNAEDGSRGTPLINAATANHPDTIQILLDHHADVNRWTNEPCCDTALSQALAKNYPACVELLQKAGGKTGEALGARRR